MADLNDLEARIAAIEDGDVMFGTVESLTKAPTPVQTNFGTSTLITITSTNLYPAPIAGDIYRVHHTGTAFHNASGAAAHTIGFTIDIPSPGTGVPGIVGYTTIPAGVEGRWYMLDATVVILQAGAGGTAQIDSLMFFSEPLTPHGWPFAEAGAVPIELAQAPEIRNSFTTTTMDLREPTLNIMAGLIFGVIDDNMIVIPSIHYVERIANRGA